MAAAVPLSGFEAYAFEGVKALLANVGTTSSAGTPWKEVKSDEKLHLKVYQAEPAKGVSAKIFKGIIELPYAMSAVVDVIQDLNTRTRWDKNIQNLQKEDITKLSDSGDVICAFRSATKAVGPISGRDFVDAIVVGRLSTLPAELRALAPKDTLADPDSCLINGGMGAPGGHPSFPETKEFVRGLNLPGCGWVFEPLGDKSVRIHYCVQTDLKGWLPSSVVNGSLTGMFGDFFGCLIKRLQELHP